LRSLGQSTHLPKDGDPSAAASNSVSAVTSTLCWTSLLSVKDTRQERSATAGERSICAVCSPSKSKSSSLALEYGADEDETIAALLHDAIEDAPAALGAQKTTAVRGWIRLKFGERVLEIVEGCTDTDADPKPPWRVRKEQYVTRIAHEPPSVLLVSMADKLHNVRALATDYRAVGDALWRRFNPEAGRDGTFGYLSRARHRLLTPHQTCGRFASAVPCGRIGT